MASKTQHYGPNPLAVRDTNHYQREYVQQFVEKWDELIDWDARSASEGDFFIRELRKRGARKVLDVATGTGFHSVRLLQWKPTRGPANVVPRWSIDLLTWRNGDSGGRSGPPVAPQGDGMYPSLRAGAIRWHAFRIRTGGPGDRLLPEQGRLLR